MTLPVVDLADPPERAAAAIDAAFRDVGFCYVAGHGVDPDLTDAVDAAARAFFARPAAEKDAVAMRHGGRAWRGWFPLGGELTDGVPDGKEGYYFGAELPARHPRVVAGTPLHGANLFPADPPALRTTVLAWLDAMGELGHRLASLVGRGLGLGPAWFDHHLTADPTVLFRIFRYPPTATEGWGVAEHTDYGLLTILHQDGRGGLEVRSRDGWVEAPPVEGAFVVNIGDWLAALTGGRYVSTPHRVRNASDGDRLSLAYFFDPGWDVRVQSMPGTYGDYLLAKVAKVFPDLASAANLPP